VFLTRVIILLDSVPGTEVPSDPPTILLLLLSLLQTLSVRKLACPAMAHSSELGFIYLLNYLIIYLEVLGIKPGLGTC
jgi:hypothetical protein